MIFIRSKIGKFILISFVLLLAFAGIFLYVKKNNKPSETFIQITPNIYQTEPPVQNNQQQTLPVDSNSSSPELTTPASLPGSSYLNVPFMVQAPDANWDAVHEEACEEASLNMVYHYIKETTISDSNTDLNGILDFETKNNYGPSISLDQLREVARDYFGLKNGKVKYNITIDDIKRELADGKPVIVGAAGKILPNPNFRNGGPNYHMLVIIGYDEKGFITNDPGTRNGKNFRYTFNALYNAIHDWNSTNILDGGKNILVFN